jgi:PIN like domain
VRFFVDNNLSQKLAQGMRAFGEDVDHLQDHFPDDIADTSWLEYIGNSGFFLITRDNRIRRNPAELAALKRFGVGAFFLGGKHRNRCELIQQLVRNWPLIKDYAAKKAVPFAVRVRPTGSKLDEIPLH